MSIIIRLLLSSLPIPLQAPRSHIFTIPIGVDSKCTLDTCSLATAFITYDPSLTGNALYVGLFGAILVVQVIQGLYYRTSSFAFAMFAGLVLEIIGYVGRVQMHFNPFAENPFLMQVFDVPLHPTTSH